MVTNRVVHIFALILLFAIHAGAQPTIHGNPVETIELSSGNPTVLGVELCGSTYPAMMLIGPKNEDGSLDAVNIISIRQPVGDRLYRYAMPDTMEISMRGHTATDITVGEHRGRVSFLGINWRSNKRTNKRIWKDLDRSITDLLGPPYGEDKKAKDWKNDEIHIAILREPELHFVGVAFICKTAFDELTSERETTGTKGKGGTDILTADLSTLDYPPAESVFFGSSLIEAIQVYGEPEGPPCYAGPELQVANFYGVQSFFGPDAGLSLWFIDGEVAKIVFGSPPIPEPEINNDKIFQWLKRRNSETFGDPIVDEEIVGDGFRRAVWQLGDKYRAEGGVVTNEGRSMGINILFDLTQDRRFEGEVLIGPGDGDPWCEQAEKEIDQRENVANASLP